MGSNMSSASQGTAGGAQTGLILKSWGPQPCYGLGPWPCSHVDQTSSAGTLRGCRAQDPLPSTARSCSADEALLCCWWGNRSLGEHPYGSVQSPTCLPRSPPMHRLIYAAPTPSRMPLRCTDSRVATRGTGMLHNHRLGPLPPELPAPLLSLQAHTGGREHFPCPQRPSSSSSRPDP